MDNVWIFKINDIGTSLKLFLRRMDGTEIFVGEEIIHEDGNGTETPESLLEHYLYFTRFAVYSASNCPMTCRWIKSAMFTDDTPTEFTSKDIEEELIRNKESFWPDTETVTP